MGLRDRIQASRAEERVIGGVPWRPWDSPYWRFNIGGPVHPSRSVMGVDKSLALPALYSGTKLLAENAGSLSIQTFIEGDNGKPVRYQGPSFFDKPSDYGTTFDWIHTCLSSLVLHGNAWGLITGRDVYGYPTGIEWQPPEYVVVEDDQYQPFNPLRSRIYLYGRKVDRSELFHIRAFTLPGRIEGISLIRAFGLTILAGLKSADYGVEWFEAGGFPPGILQNTEIEVDRDQALEMRELLVDTLRQHVPLVYGRDWDYKPITVPPSEAQFIEAIQMNAGQIAALLNLPPDRIGGTRGDSLTYSTTEQSTLQVIEALRPWLTRLESAFFDILPRRRFVRFRTDDLLKTDLKTRMDIWKTARDEGFLTVDEIREEMGKDPLPKGIGSEAMPLTLMNAMATRAGGIPKTLLPQVALEMDLAADKLEKLEKSGIAKPDAPLPLAQDAASFLAGLVNVQRDGGEAGYEAAKYIQKIEARLAELTHDVVTLQEDVSGRASLPVPESTSILPETREQELKRRIAELEARRPAGAAPIHVHVHQDAGPGAVPPEERADPGVPGLNDMSAMISLNVPDGMLPKLSQGVTDHHITVAFLGKDVNDDDFESAAERAKDAAAAIDGPVTANIGGPLHTFPPSDPNGGKRIDYAPVDLDDKGYQLRHSVSDLSKSQHTNWVPHVTMRYSNPEDALPEMPDPVPVQFTHLTVKRGADERHFPFGTPPSQDAF